MKADEVLVRLDDTDLNAKLQQAKASLTSAEAMLQQAQIDEERLLDWSRRLAGQPAGVRRGVHPIAGRRGPISSALRKP